MNSEFFKNFNIGVINLMGFWVPGILGVFFLIITIFSPILCLFFAYQITGCHNANTVVLGWEEVGQFLAKVQWTLVFLTIVFAYLFGYLLRLYTPDKLDKISAERIAQGMLKEWLARIKDEGRINSLIKEGLLEDGSIKKITGETIEEVVDGLLVPFQLNDLVLTN